MDELRIKYVDINSIKPYKNNPRINEKAIPYVANSIKEFGFKVPIVIDKNNIIVAGHTRYLASKLLSLDKVPCIVADDLNESQIKAFRLVDNKVSEFSVWDIKTLKSELEQLEDVDVTVFGLDDEINNIIDILEDEGLGKVAEGVNEKFSITFSSTVSNISILKDYINQNSKKDLEDIFMKVIKEMYNENNLY